VRLEADGLTIDPVRLHEFTIRPGLHAYNRTFTEAWLTWRGVGGNVNVSLVATVADEDSAQLTLIVGITNAAQVNASDYVLLAVPTFAHGRAGTVRTSLRSASGVASGLRTSTLHLLQGEPMDVPRGAMATSAMASWDEASHGAPCAATPYQCPTPLLSVSLGALEPVIISTEASLSCGMAIARASHYRAREAATLERYGEWAEVKDAMQTSLMWSFIYDPKEGLVAPVTRNWAFSPRTVDGDQSEGLFCWDGSFASYMLSLDALDLAISNLIQIIKGRTSSGFIPSYSAGTTKTRDRSNPPVTSKIMSEISRRWGKGRTRWVVELCFDDLYNWNTWMYAMRREPPEALLSWGSDPFPFAPDGSQSTHGAGGGGASLESGLDNGPVMEGVPFNVTGRYLQDEYDAGYSGMFLMDCMALIELATMLGRDDAVAELRRRFDVVNGAMLRVLWNESAGYFQNRRSADLTPIERMAPTHFYPLLAGPASGPSEEQARATVVKHLTNPVRFAVWPSGMPPKDHPAPPEAARPLVQWRSKSGRHTLCCTLRCNFNVRGNHTKVRYEAMGVASVGALTDGETTALYAYGCGLNGSDVTLAPERWTPAQGGPCIKDSTAPALLALTSRSGPAAADLHALELWYHPAPSDHYVVASDSGKADAAARGYHRVALLGYVWPQPGTPNATSRYGLPSISKDDAAYIDQNYWHGRLWSPMIQIVYWALDSGYRGAEVQGARAGLVAQSKALLLKEWRGYGNMSMPGGSYAGSGRYVYENFDADTAEGYGYSSEAQPMYSWGALAGFIGLQASGYYEALGEDIP